MTFVRLEPPPTYCWSYGSGGCCWDYHLDKRVIIPSDPGSPICDAPSGGKLTEDKKIVNCQECLEMIHS